MIGENIFWEALVSIFVKVFFFEKMENGKQAPSNKVNSALGVVVTCDNSVWALRKTKVYMKFEFDVM